MSQPFLMAKCRGTNLGAYRVLGTTAAQLGSAFGTAENGYGVNQQEQNRILQVGSKILLCWIGTQIFRSTDGGSTWTAVYTVPNIQSTQTNLHTGLHIINNSGALWVVGLYGNTNGSHFQGVTSTDFGATWSNGSELSGNSPGFFVDEFIYNNQLFVVGTVTGLTFAAWNPVTGSFSLVNSITGSVTGGTTGAGGTAFATHKGQLYMINSASTGVASTQTLSLWRYTAGTMQELATLPKGGGTNWGSWVPTGFKSALFDDVDGNMYCIYGFTNGTNKGFMCAKIVINDTTGAATITDVTSTVIPTALAYPNNPASFGNPKVHSFDDIESVPGAIKKLIYIAPTDASVTYTQFLWVNNFQVTLTSGTGFNVGDSVTCGSASGVVASISGTTLNIYVKNGVDWPASGTITDTTTSTSTSFSGGAFNLGQLSQEGTGLDVTIQPPRSSVEAAGARIFTSPGDYFNWETTYSRVATGLQFSIKVQGPLGTETVSLFPYFNKYVNAPNMPMTLSTVTGGSATLNANNHQIDNVTADGTTVYTFIWLVDTDAANIGQYCRLAIRAA